LRIFDDRRLKCPSRCRAPANGAAESRKLDERAVDTLGSDMLLLGVNSGVIMSADMGTFRVDVEIENPANPGEKRTISSVLVDTGAELSWFPAEALESLGIERYARWHFRQANGTILERWARAGSGRVKAMMSTILQPHRA
jgi:hypothetical protein